jgi:hypothetical protein
LEDRKKEMSELNYAQEYLGLFLEELRRFFDESLIERACTGTLPTLAEAELMKERGIRAMGNDLARMGGDYFTAEVFHRFPNQKIRQIDHYQEKKLLTTRNEDLIVEYNKKWKLNEIGIDAGAGTLGVSVLDHLRNIPGMKNRIIPMNNRKIVIDKDSAEQRLFKEDLYESLKSLMEHDEIVLLNNDDIKNSLRSVQFEIVKDLHDSPKSRIFGKDTHIVEGIVRGVYLANQKHLNLRIISI